jgi:hypothetical protein
MQVNYIHKHKLSSDLRESLKIKALMGWRGAARTSRLQILIFRSSLKKKKFSMGLFPFKNNL